MSEHPICRYPVPRLDELAADVRARIEAVQEKAGFFGLSNRLANFIHLRPNEDFYLLGRVPRERS